MEHELLQKEIDGKWLKLIKSGDKIYEGRLRNKVEEWALCKGKIIKFVDNFNHDDSVIVVVEDLLLFSNFGEAYDQLGDQLIPNGSFILSFSPQGEEKDNSNKKDVIDLYNGIYKYENEELKSGITSNRIRDEKVVCIKMKVLDI